MIKQAIKTGAYFFTFLVLIGLAWYVLQGYQPAWIVSFQIYLTNQRVYFILWRVFLLIFFILTWPTFVNAMVRKKTLSKEEVDSLLIARWKIAAWLIVIELLLGENILSLAWQALARNAA